jgi:DNA-binding XRE family transcriptional regulator
MQAFEAFTSPVASATLSVAVDIEWNIGDVITKLRKRRRMNQTVLGEKVGVNKATIVRAEQGDPKVSRETYIKIATVLGTKLAVLEMEAARLESGSERDQPTSPRKRDDESSHEIALKKRGRSSS